MSSQRVITLRLFQRIPRIVWEQRPYIVTINGAWAPPVDGSDLWLDADEIVLDGDGIYLAGSGMAVAMFQDMGLDADLLALDGDELQIDKAA